MNDTAGAVCGRCGTPIEQQNRGRPRLWCGDTCRKAAQRDRDRPVLTARRLTGQLAMARADAARTRRQMQDTARETGALALDVAAAGTTAELDAAIAALNAAALKLAALARRHADATRRAGDLHDQAE